MLGLDMSNCPLPDYEIISRLQKIISAHKEFTTISQKFAETAQASIPFQNSSNSDPFERELMMFTDPSGQYSKDPRRPYEDPSFSDEDRSRKARGVMQSTPRLNTSVENQMLSKNYSVRSSSLIDLRNETNGEESVSSRDHAEISGPWLDDNDSPDSSGDEARDRPSSVARYRSNTQRAVSRKERGSSAPCKDRGVRKMVSIAPNVPKNERRQEPMSQRKRSTGILKTSPK
jgi:hypothetical protein